MSAATLQNVLDLLDDVQNVRKCQKVLAKYPTECLMQEDKKAEKKLFSKCWHKLIKQLPAHDLQLHEQVLRSLCADTTICCINQPLLLGDYLTECCNFGGIIRLLSLKGLFFLIQKHNFDCPDFYEKLYQMLDASVLHSAYTELLFELLELFMSSSHLPAYVVAAFAKRLSRLCLSSAGACHIWIIPFVYNLLKNHPACLVLIHRSATAASNAEDRDVYDWDAPTIEQSNALASSLWELHALKTHFYFKVGLRYKIFEERMTKRAFRLDDYRTVSTANFLRIEQRKQQTHAALRDDIESSLFAA